MSFMEYQQEGSRLCVTQRVKRRRAERPPDGSHIGIVARMIKRRPQAQCEAPRHHLHSWAGLTPPGDGRLLSSLLKPKFVSPPD